MEKISPKENQTPTNCGVLFTSFKLNSFVDPSSSYTKYPVEKIYMKLPLNPKLDVPYHMLKITHDQQNHHGWKEQTSYRKNQKKKSIKEYGEIVARIFTCAENRPDKGRICNAEKLVTKGRDILKGVKRTRENKIVGVIFKTSHACRSDEAMGSNVVSVTASHSDRVNIDDLLIDSGDDERKHQLSPSGQPRKSLIKKSRRNLSKKSKKKTKSQQGQGLSKLKGYSCRHCREKFPDKKSFNFHLLQPHDFPCHVSGCNSKFETKSKCVLHLEAHHSIQNIQIDDQNSCYITSERSPDNIQIAEKALEWIK